MPLHLFNTLSGKVEEFTPSQDQLVRMYACGPTVYDYGHIGNFRTFIAIDLLRRFLRQSGLKLKHVMNITDVDDKIIRNAGRAGLSVQQYTKKYETAFLEDMDTLNIEHAEMIVRATEHIPEMARFIRELVEKGFAYRADDGSYYFRIAKFPQYGGNSPRRILPAWKTARAWTWTNTIKIAPAIPRCGKRPSRAKRSGRPKSAWGARAGISNAP